ncbi:MAG: hypothetical protein IPQ02_04950 [Saprospiraceae bacterium]|nr:hypothetical protein [Candidatus Defluviibacterium haderslevense]
MTWNKLTNFEYFGIGNSGQATLQMDINSGLQNPILNSFRLATNSIIPKQINNMPTPWMPGNPFIKILKHKLLLNNLSNPMPGRLKVFDNNNNQIDISNVCILLQDPIEGNILFPTIITKSEIDVNAFVS